MMFSFWISASPVWSRKKDCSREAVGLPGAALHPLPHLLCLGRVGVDDQVLVHRLRHLRFDLAPRSA